jgi:hypothetical protein
MLLAAVKLYNSQIEASKVDFWNRKQEVVKLEFEQKMYPPRIKVTILGDCKFKLPIKFKGCLNDDLDTELIFPLISHLPVPLLGHTCTSRKYA